MKTDYIVHKLGDISDIVGGGTPSKSISSYYLGTIPWATVRDMQTDTVDTTEFSITPEAVTNSSTNIIPKGNVIIATRVGLGKICKLKNDTAINQDLKGIVPKNLNQLSIDFLFWWLKSIDYLIVKEGTGATVKGVKLPFVKSLQIPIPPLPEQHRIVSILDETFDGIEKAKANTEKNLENARKVFESYLNDTFSQRREGWIDSALNSLCEIKHGFAFDGKDFSLSVPKGNPVVITPGNFTVDGRLEFNETNTKRYSNTVPEGYRFNVNDLVVVMTDLSTKMKILGRPAFIEKENIIHNQRIGRVILINDSVLIRLIYYFMMSPKYLNNIKESSTGTMVKHTAPKRILNNKISYPKDRAEQQLIVSKLDSLLNNVRHIESIYQQKLVKLEELKQSLLHQAFNGDL